MLEKGKIHCTHFGKYFVLISVISVTLAAFVGRREREREKGKERRGWRERERGTPSRDVLTYFRLQDLTSEVHLPDYIFPSELLSQCKDSINKRNNLLYLGMKDCKKRSWGPPLYLFPLQRQAFLPCGGSKVQPISPSVKTKI